MSSQVKANHGIAPLPSGLMDQSNSKANAKTISNTTLSHEQTCEKRNSHLHNLCVEMLRYGYHRAYTELFNLVDKRRKARIAAGPGSQMSLEVELETATEYLDTLKEKLCAAEKNERVKSYKEQYQHILDLANFFNAENITWLSDHFYKKSLAISRKVALDSGKSLCEASEKCGLAAEANGRFEESREFLAEARRISRGRLNWKHESDKTWHQQNSQHYARILIRIAQSKSDKAEITDILEEATKAANESRIDLTMAQVNYNYGCHLYHTKKFNESRTVLQRALHSAVQIGNNELIQKISKQLATVSKEVKSSSSTLYIDQAAEFLKLAVEKTADDPLPSIDALSEMAILYNMYGKYNEAQSSIDQAYEAASQEGCESREITTRVISGAIHGNTHLLQFRTLLTKSTQNMDAVRQIICWKNTADVMKLN